MAPLPDSLILHSYSMSPYAEKIRAMLGYSGIHWQSVSTSAAPPRPLLEPLTGGYRRIPVAQIGADVFCDSRSIAREIARLANLPELSPEQCSEAATDWISRAEGPLFFASVLSSVSLAFLINGLRQVSFKGLQEIRKDRANLSSSPDLKLPSRKEAQSMVFKHLGYMEEHLSTDFLLGDKPELADFAVYHGLWMMHVQGKKRFISRYPKVRAWIERINAFGHGAMQELAAEKALDIALQAQPRPITSEPQHTTLVGEHVTVGPSDYCLETTQGTLVAHTEHTIIVARETPQTGVVHVHFPTQGYTLSQA